MIRSTRLLAITALIIPVLVAFGEPLHAQNAQFTKWEPSVLSPLDEISPGASCGSLISLTGYEFSIVTATMQKAEGGQAVAGPGSTQAQDPESPDFCRVVGLIQPEIRFEVDLPTAWNGRLYMFGNGGYAGEALDSPARVATSRRALSRGFATAQTNTGHDGSAEPLGTFAASPQKFVDYAFRAVHITSVTAKRIVQAYYARAAQRAYFDGCSTGGRQGLMSAQRFPEDFDGIVVGAPVLNFSGTMIGYAAYQKALSAGPLDAEHLKLLADAVYAKCDARDGLKDGVIDDPRQCGFSPSADLERCTAGGSGAGCFTPAQLNTLEIIYGGVKRGGVELVPGWPVGAEIAAAGRDGTSTSGWIPWFVAPPSGKPIQVAFGETFFKNIAFGKTLADYDWATFQVDADYQKLESARAALDATNPDLSRFKERGGKILSYFGWADPALNPMMEIGYYESVQRALGPSTDDFYRLFMVPGMFHCGGGVGASSFDAITPLVEWTERGTMPKSIAASRLVDGKVVRTRPLCPYPATAAYNGTGNPDEAASFSCKPPATGSSSGR
jgi:Tannase and feruloyl esterase